MGCYHCTWLKMGTEDFMLWIIGSAVVLALMFWIVFEAWRENEIMTGLMGMIATFMLCVFLVMTSMWYAYQFECPAIDQKFFSALKESYMYKIENAHKRKDGVWQLIIQSYTEEGAPFLCRTSSERLPELFIWRNNSAIPFTP